MRVADVTVVESLLRLRHLTEVLADRDSVPGHVVGEMTVEAHPVARAVEPRGVPDLRFRQRGRETRRLELKEVDDALGLHQLTSNIVGGAQALREDHELTIRTVVRLVKIRATKFTSPTCLISRRGSHPSAVAHVIRSPSPAAAPPPPRAASPGRRPASSSRSRAPRRPAS